MLSKRKRHGQLPGLAAGADKVGWLAVCGVGERSVMMWHKALMGCEWLRHGGRKSSLGVDSNNPC